MLNLLLVSVFGRVNSDTNDRVNSIYDYLPFNTKIVTTDFSHRDKEYHKKDSIRNVDYIHVSPYKNNLSLTRIFSHWIFAFRLFLYLIKNGEKYKVIYCIIPTPSSGLICSLYKLFTKDKILVVDIIDIWPEGLIPIYKQFKLISFFLLPWKWLSIITYKSANAIFAATSNYQLQASKYNPRAFSSYFPLGIDSKKAKSIKSESNIVIHKPDDEIWITYAGNLGNSYDFDSMINSIVFAQNHLKKFRLKFLILGGGVKENYLNTKLQKSGIDYLITGNLEYKDYLSYLHHCEIGLNIYIENSEVIQSYKFNDYIVSGLYVINNLKGDTAYLIDKYKVGENINGHNIKLDNILLSILNNWDSLKLNQAARCTSLISEALSKQTIYQKLENDLLKLVNGEQLRK